MLIRTDMLGRLTDAELYNANRPRPLSSDFPLLRDINTFTERRMEYDLNGNIRSFERYNGINSLKYKYPSSTATSSSVNKNAIPGTKDSRER